MKRTPFTPAERDAAVERIRRIEQELAALAERAQRAYGPRFFPMLRRPAEALRRARAALAEQRVAAEPPPRRPRPRLELPAPPRSLCRLEVLPGGRDGDGGRA